jgi:hypothetical protein
MLLFPGGDTMVGVVSIERRSDGGGGGLVLLLLLLGTMIGVC